MTQSDAIDMADEPATVSSLVADLRALGLGESMTVMVHSSLSRLGYVSGGAHAVVTALLEVIDDQGTLVMPTHSGDLSDPAHWSNPPVPESWWDRLRAEMPAYDLQLTAAVSMGAIVDCFRHVPGVRRSSHPTVSAAAVGPNAATIVEGHELEAGLGESSPQARLYELDGHILLLGISHENNTSLHLAEYRSAAPGAEWTTEHSPLMISGERRWQPYRSLPDDVSDFDRLGEDFARTGRETSGPVGAGRGRMMRARELVDFGTEWMRSNRA